MKDSNREAFESWATDKFPIAGLGQFEKHNNGTYLQRSIRNMYEAWQAAKAQAGPEIQQSKQAEIDSLIFQVADMKSRLNDKYTAGQTSMYLTKQAEIDDLKAQLKAVHESRADSVEYCRVIEAQEKNQ